jgi:hypothetical protein|tara:strand:- start:74 stop:415 length:342 start_codon:yes stop_codon:yes gene_type:complete
LNLLKFSFSASIKGDRGEIGKDSGGFMLNFLRVIRAFAGLLFLAGIAGIIAQLGFNILHVDILMRSSVIVIMVGTLFAAFWLWVFLGLRYVINEIHEKEQGKPHPSLTKIWHL